jgi:hypothetical protein
VLTIDALSDVGSWSAVQADGTTPSTELAIRMAPVGGEFAPGAEITATERATGHRLRRSVGPVDLTDESELHVSLRGDRRAGPGGAPFFLELRLGSDALPIGADGNGWHRLLPLQQRRHWEVVPLSLDDLPAPVRVALSRIELRCLEAPFTAGIDDLIAVHPRMLADADRALVRALSGITVGGTAVAVAVRATDEPIPAGPALDITQFDIHHAASRAGERRVLRDWTDAGPRPTTVGEPYDVDFAITPIGTGRAEQAALLEAALDRLAPVTELAVDGQALPAELLWLAGADRVGGVLGPVPVLHLRVGVRRPAASARPAHAVAEIGLLVEHREVG